MSLSSYQKQYEPEQPNNHNTNGDPYQVSEECRIEVFLGIEEHDEKCGNQIEEV